jgi:hypothetical protein
MKQGVGVGDTVDLTDAEAISIEVEKPAKKGASRGTRG